MIDLYCWTSANVQKVLLFLEEPGLFYRIMPIDVGKGLQFEPDFARISPNSKVPAIVDRAPADGDEPMGILESGAILLYLAKKIGRFLSTEPGERMEALQWLFCQVGGLGPVGGQASHLPNYAPEPIDYALKRYDAEVDRLLAVLDRKLEERPYITGRLSRRHGLLSLVRSFVRRGQRDFEPFSNLPLVRIAEASARERAVMTGSWKYPLGRTSRTRTISRSGSAASCSAHAV